jgi:death on curing protein
MNFLDIDDVLTLHQRLILQSGGSAGLLDRGKLESALAQPQMTFDGQELYPTIIEKAAALGYSLIQNHAFVDGNKRIGHAVMETFLVLNRFEISASTDEQEAIILQIAASQMSRDDFTTWLQNRVIPTNS